MSTSIGSIAAYNFTDVHNIWSSRRFQTISFNPARVSVISKHKDKCSFLRNQTLRSSDTKDVVVYSSVQPGPPLPSDPFPSSWKLWILGVVITAILPCWRNKWGPFQFQRFKKEVETTVETAEHVADIVEKVAEEMENVAEEVADHLPQDGKLKDAVTFVEKLAKETAKDAHLAQDILEKVEEVEKDVESFIDPLIVQPNGTIKKSSEPGDQY